MAGVSDLLLLPPPNHDDEEEGDHLETLDLIHPSFPHHLDRPIHPFFPQSPHIPPSDPSLLHDSEDESIDFELRELGGSDSESESYSASDSRSDLFEGEEVSLAFDLFDRIQTHQTHVSHERSSNPSNFRVFEGNVDMGSNFLELGLGFGVDSGHEGIDQGEICDGVAGEGSEDGFFVGNSEDSKSESGLSSEICEFDGDGLHFQISDAFGSESDSDDGRVVPIDLNSDGGEAPDMVSEDLGVLPLCWDCLRLGDGRDQIEDFEWEEVERRTAVEEDEAMNMEIETVINMAFDASINEEQSISIHEMQNAAAAEGPIQSLDWEVLLAVNDLVHSEHNPVQEEETESYLGDHDDYVQTTEYEVLFGQFTEAENSLRGSPPAAKHVVENLPSIFLAKEDIEKNNALCAICKDEISLDERVKRLPCAHHYHGECILPWLGIRNTCPVCRFELPTDDPDYEHWRYQRAARGVLEEGSRVRYDLEMLPEAEWW
ncbi:hypothetical protein AAC387_Pa07g1819 [Persea americana]